MTYGWILAAALWAQEESVTALKNPFNEPADRAAGARIFRSQCASCHGADGRGGQGTPDFTTGRFKRASSDEGLFKIVNLGVPGTTMPGFPLSATATWQVLSHIRSLGPAQGGKAKLTGDAARGEKLFREQGCARCHSGLAPDLTGIGRTHTPEELRRSITEPQIDVNPAYWRMRATTKDGRKLAGLRMNEDSFTVQFLDNDGKLRSIGKEALAEYEILKNSTMPILQLTSTEVDDLIAYLSK